MKKYARKQFASPSKLRGKLFEGSPEVSLPKVINFLKKHNFTEFTEFTENYSQFLICIGDVVSNAFFENDYLRNLVKYYFIDEKTQRGAFSGLILESKDKADLVEINIKNPKGTINSKVFQFIKDTKYDNKQYIVKIDGEEDLLVLPAVLEFEKGFCFYGQPNITDLNSKNQNLKIPAGCVGIQIDNDVKKYYKEIFAQTFE